MEALPHYTQTKKTVTFASPTPLQPLPGGVDQPKEGRLRSGREKTNSIGKVDHFPAVHRENDRKVRNVQKTNNSLEERKDF
jgi:hypothetical protein